MTKVQTESTLIIHYRVAIGLYIRMDKNLIMLLSKAYSYVSLIIIGMRL